MSRKLFNEGYDKAAIEERIQAAYCPLTTCLPPTNHLRTTYLLPTYCLLTAYRLPTDCLPTAYLLTTCSGGLPRRTGSQQGRLLRRWRLPLIPYSVPSRRLPYDRMRSREQGQERSKQSTLSGCCTGAARAMLLYDTYCGHRDAGLRCGQKAH